MSPSTAVLPPPGETAAGRPRLEQIRARAVPQTLGPAVDPGFAITHAADVRRLLMRAAARALDDGRTEITVTDVEAALNDAPAQAAAG